MHPEGNDQQSTDGNGRLGKQGSYFQSADVATFTCVLGKPRWEDNIIASFLALPTPLKYCR